MEWKNIYRGLLMGTSDLIPGISGGTIAILLGIYDRLVHAIDRLFSKEWKKQLGFLIPLGVGIVAAIFSLSKLMEWLLKHHSGPTYFFFLGLILGVLPFLLRQSKAKQTFKVNQYILLAIGLVLIASLMFLNEGDGAIIENMTWTTYVWLFVSGFIGSSALIMPGISGSFMLLVLGVYDTVIHAISNLKLDIIIVTGLGIALGIITMSKVINYFLTHFRTSTFAVAIGMVCGSVFVIFPGLPGSVAATVISLVMFVVGLLTAYLLGKIEY